MKMSDYGVWVVGENYDANIEQEEITRWYHKGDRRLIPNHQQIEDGCIYQTHFSYFVNGKLAGSFRLLIDKDEPTEPFELELWDPANTMFRACCLVTRQNIWEKMASAKFPP